MSKSAICLTVLLAGLLAWPAAAGDLDFSQAPVGLVLEGLCRQYGYNLVVNAAVDDTISVHLGGMSFDNALASLAQGTALNYRLEGKTLIVSGTNLANRLVTLSYVDARAVRDALLKFVSSRGRIEAFTGDGAIGSGDILLGSGNSVLITDVPGQLDGLVEMAHALDKAPAQVAIEAKIVETSLSKDEKLGIDWQISLSASGASAPTTFPFPKGSNGGDFRPTPDPNATSSGGSSSTTTSGPAFPPGEQFPYSQRSDYTYGRLDASGLSATLDLLSARSTTNLVSAPKVTTLDGRTAEIMVGLQVPVALYERARDTGIMSITGYEEQKVGMKLAVTPRVGRDGRILLRVQPEVSEIVEYRGQFNERPVTATRQADAEVIVRDGETLVLGGMIKELTIEDETRVPFLGDIPILGSLFRHTSVSKQKVDLLVFVTPHIIARGDE